MKNSVAKTIIIILVVLVLILVEVFLMGRYGWKLLGFSACESAGIESVEVNDGSVRITGFCPGSFPEGFCGYHARERGGTLYIGFRFSGLFGIFETGDFDITVPVKGDITQVVIKTKNNEYPVWPVEEDTQDVSAEEENAAMENVPANEQKGAGAEIPAAYEAVIGKYRTALTEQWSGQQLMDAGMSFMIRDVASGEVGYAVSDLDGDGTAELAIGFNSQDAYYGKMVLELYTLDEDGEAVQLFAGGERNSWYYAGGALFANVGSSSADDSFETTRQLKDGGMTDLTYTTDPADYVQLGLTPFTP